ncbi:arylamine N-acetyltransferase family protein [Phytoactinopolyspora limicola]|uniref:arylamine N-acetyltransferase family protein n=1 Tax=Phytoactinopolyspora limicola TaxID=2715536 RepID=UPI00140B3B0A|nr:arylamine N-acetyltransferase [Phytoactinopolyspora limicola]
MPVSPLTPQLRDQYVRRLNVERTAAPSVAGLRDLHRAHLDHVPFENLEIQLGRATTIDPAESATRIVNGRGGYCFHLNGAFAALLTSLGYNVTLIRAAVPDGTDTIVWGNHLALLVEIDGATWLTDVGFGDGFRDPLPLRPGVVEQPPFTYRLEDRDGQRWRFDHDKMSSVGGYDFDVTPTQLAEFEPQHTRLSTDPESGFVQKLVVQSRRPDHTLVLRGCVRTRIDGDGRTSREVTSADEWLGIMTGEFGLDLTSIGDDVLLKLWRRVRATHDEWVRAGRP